MGHRRKSAVELLAAGAKPNRVAQRKLEDDIALGVVPDPAKEPKPDTGPKRLALIVFIDQVKKERESFFERLVPGQTVCKEYDAEFNWREDHPLTVIRKYAQQIADGSIVSGDYTKRACARFLGNLAQGASRELFVDPVAVENIAVWFREFGEPGFDLQP